MGVLIRGAKNAFRNTVRTLSVTLILALSVGLALVMLLSYQTVQAKIDSVKSSIGNTVTVTPAGAQGFQGGGEPLTTDQANQVKSLAHVTAVATVLEDRQTPSTDTSLASSIDAGTLGTRFQQREQRDLGGNAAPAGGVSISGSTGENRTFTIPIQVTGVSDASQITQSGTKITAGTVFDASKDAAVAVVGADLATKNNLKVGSTFTAYSGTTFTVAAIFDTGTKFTNAGFYVPLATLQRLSDQSGDISSATVTVDDIGNVDGVVSAIKDKLGSDKADVTSNKDQADQALSPLENIKSISLYSLIGALVAGAVITLLTMIMIVRERRREIGVLKAIGASNIGVMMQFVSESLVLTLLGSVLGLVLGVAFSNPVLTALVNNSSSTSTGSTGGGFGGGQGLVRVARLGSQFGGGVQNAISNLHTSVGLNIILYGLLAAVAIAVLGSAIPAWLIAKVKPAEVMRSE